MCAVCAIVSCPDVYVYLRNGPSGLRNRSREIFRKESFVVSTHWQKTSDPPPPNAYFAPDVIQQVDRANTLRNFDPGSRARDSYSAHQPVVPRSTHRVSTPPRYTRLLPCGGSGGHAIPLVIISSRVVLRRSIALRAHVRVLRVHWCG